MAELAWGDSSERFVAVRYNENGVMVEEIEARSLAQLMNRLNEDVANYSTLELFANGQLIGDAVVLPERLDVSFFRVNKGD